MTVYFRLRCRTKLLRNKNLQTIQRWRGRPARKILAAVPAIARSCALFAVACLAATGSAHAAVVPWMEIEEMTRRAEVIALGRVDRVDSEWTADGAMIITRAVIDVEKGLKGGPLREVTVEVPGGRVGDQMMVASGAPGFERGERLILFLERPGGKTPGGKTAGTPFGVVGWNLGKMTVRRDARTGRDVVHGAPGPAVAYVGPDGRPIDPSRSRRGPEELGRFLQRIEELLEAPGPSGDPAAPGRSAGERGS